MSLLGLEITSLGAYSASLLQLDSIAVSLPAVVLHNQNYNIRIEIACMRKYGVKNNLQEITLKILNQAIPGITRDT